MVMSHPALAQPAPDNAIEISVGIDDAKRSIKPGGGLDESQSFRDCPECPQMVVVPAGSFMMGERDSLHSSNEPQHQVTIARPFAIGMFNVTFGEWDACVADGGCAGQSPSDKGWGRGDMPLLNVTWDAAHAYAQWLSRKTGKHYRLPSEAEWEYAARAGTTTGYWWGDNITRENANYDDKIVTGARSKTVPVKSYKPNPWGLYQVLGNVRQWVEDCWSDNYVGAPTDGSVWVHEPCYDDRVVRGGGFGAKDTRNTSASRSYAARNNRDSWTGIRVVRDLP
jgi:formylglycine-generating enzyme required for sulfatase activity